jgi:Kinesin motor domain
MPPVTPAPTPPPQELVAPTIPKQSRLTERRVAVTTAPKATTSRRRASTLSRLGTKSKSKSKSTRKANKITHRRTSACVNTTVTTTVADSKAESEVAPASDSDSEFDVDTDVKEFDWFGLTSEQRNQTLVITGYNGMPQVLLEEIGSYLCLSDAACMFSTCRAWEDTFVNHGARFWRTKFFQMCKNGTDSLLPSVATAVKERTVCWKTMVWNQHCDKGKWLERKRTQRSFNVHVIVRMKPEKSSIHSQQHKHLTVSRNLARAIRTNIASADDPDNFDEEAALREMFGDFDAIADPTNFSARALAPVEEDDDKKQTVDSSTESCNNVTMSTSQSEPVLSNSASRRPKSAGTVPVWKKKLNSLSNKKATSSKNKKRKSISRYGTTGRIRPSSASPANFRRPGFGSSVSRNLIPPSLFEKDLSRSHKRGKSSIVSINKRQVVAHLAGLGVRFFKFNRVFPASSSQRHIYSELSYRLTSAVLAGMNATCLAYGQTGSGKTYSIIGPPGVLSNGKTQDFGLILHVALDLFAYMSNMTRHGKSDVSYEVGLSYTQIYDNQVTALAPPRTARQFTDVIQILREGEAKKRVHSTAMNDRSSRAHSIFAIHLKQTNAAANRTVESTFSLVDLAGSERLNKSKAQGDRLAETKFINYSLHVLGRCINALAANSSHVPYRDSTLTQLLAPALGGNCLTTVLVNCASDAAHIDETLCSLRFGERAGNVVNRTRADSTTVRALLKKLRRKMLNIEGKLHQMKKMGYHRRPLVYIDASGRHIGAGAMRAHVKYVQLRNLLEELEEKESMIKSTLPGPSF